MYQRDGGKDRQQRCLRVSYHTCRLVAGRLVPLPYLSGRPPPSLQETAFLSRLYIKTIILPRQARDKHRESTQKRRFPHRRTLRTCKKTHHRSFLSAFPMCLSRACLGEMIVFIHKWLKRNGALRTSRQSICNSPRLRASSRAHPPAAGLGRNAPTFG